MSAAAAAEASVVLLQCYVVYKDREANSGAPSTPGFRLLLQQAMLFLLMLLYRLGRSKLLLALQRQ